ncbi:MAG: hypothetical protein LBE50_00170, partial [Gallionellaceae bacterium]|nr:hypothetical protein [Gallionellaceae bacterium]
MNSRSQIVELPDRLIIRPPAGRRILQVAFLLALVAPWLWLAQRVPLPPWHGQNPLFSDDWGWFAFWLLWGACVLFFLPSFGRAGFAITIRADGWVRQGIFSWHFPGPMFARFLASRTENHFEIHLIYGASEILFTVSGHKNQAFDFASRIIKWSRQRINGIPDTFQSRSTTDFLWFWGWIAIILFFILVFLAYKIFLSRYYLNAHAAPGMWATGMTAAFAMLAIALTGRHWIWQAGREIKTGAALWITEALAALLLIST